MAHGDFVAYYRVSTAQQGRSGLGLEGQQADVQAYLNGGDWVLRGEFTEIESGKATDNRPALTEAMKLAKLTGATLIIAKLDRLSRDAHFLIGLQKAGVPFLAVDMPAATPFTVGIMALVAQLEREAISQRTRSALAAAKARGVTLGGYRGAPPPDGKVGAEANRLKADQFASQVLPTVLEAYGRGLSLRGIAAELAQRGIETPRGGQWTASAVRSILLRQPTASAA